MYKGFLKQTEKREDSLIANSQFKQDSLIVIISKGETKYDAQQQQINYLEQQNRYLYATIKKREASNRVVDTSFIVNAKRISESSNRFYQKNDTTR